MKRMLLIGAVIAGVICGCVPSIHGIATKETMVWDEDILGTWSEPNDPNKTVMWRFDKGEGEKEYGLIYVDDKGRWGRFDVALVALGEERFLDLYPHGDACNQMNSLAQVHWVPVHTFLRVEETGQQLVVRMMDPDRVKKMLEKEPALLKHEVVDGALLLTAGTAQLQGFLRGHATDIWTDEIVLVRKK